MRRFLLLAVLTAFLLLPGSVQAQSGSFGTTVVLDGADLFVGEPNTSFREGSVYIYAWTDDGWKQTQRLTAPEPAWEDGFGTVLAREGGNLLVGQKNGPLHVFVQQGQSWQHNGVIDGPGTQGLDPGCQQYGYCGTDFGITLALEGDWLLVGNPGAVPQRQRGQEEMPEAPQGVVYAYARGADGQWSLHSSIQSMNASAGDRFGQTILFENGLALIGAPGWNDSYAGLEAVGQVIPFVFQDGNWLEANWIPFFAESAAGFGSSLSLQGRELLVGAPGANRSRGAVYAYEWQDDGSWMPMRAFRLTDAEPGERFGSGVAHPDNAIWIGAPAEREFATGSVWVFDGQEDGTVTDTPRRIQLADTVERDGFGAHLVAQGEMVIVSAPGMHHQSGALYAYAPAIPDGQPLMGPPDGLAALIGEQL
ncbi:MAG: hypothetical protein O2899_03435, partial [Bacteroidetes bacterium]|nr:hypothetical protein [Bacteroidota bacterium]